MAFPALEDVGQADSVLASAVLASGRGNAGNCDGVRRATGYGYCSSDYPLASGPRATNKLPFVPGRP